jgi:polyphosphate kinase
VKNDRIRLKNRDLSWLAFNHRVLQEAADPTVPLYERIKFLAIWSSNLDEFFRVRVASLRTLQRLKKKTQRKLDIEPDKLMKRLLKAVTLQQEEFGALFRGRIKRDLHTHGIYLVRDNELNEPQRDFVRHYFRQNVQPKLTPIYLTESSEVPFLENKALYLAVRIRRRHAVEKKLSDQVALVEIPRLLGEPGAPQGEQTLVLPRFIALPESAGRHYVMFLDDVIRLCLDEVFPNHDAIEAYAIKLTRDAELYIDDEFRGDLVEKVKKALSKRRKGVPSRFLYDLNMPKKMLTLLQETFTLDDDDLVPGGRYHNFNDLFSFPNPKDPALQYEPMPPLVQKEFCDECPAFDRVKEKDRLAHFPYHSYDCVINFLQQAAYDQHVTAIHITLYRVARNSEVVEQLIRAAHNGKQVTAFVEVKARFDEESNIHWAEEMEKAGAKVLYSIPNLKVHAKLCLVTRREDAGEKFYAYLSTGNFNESAATLYTDFGYFTADDRLTTEVRDVFHFLCREREKATFEHLLVPPFTMRERFQALIENEMRNARIGRDAFIIAKMNSLEDPEMIAKLYEASQAGVNIRLIVRGVCCLIPGIRGMSENIEVISIVDRFLEHARVFVFHNDGAPLYFLSSADWMRRNLDRRIEVGFPVYSRDIQRQLRATLDLQLQDNVKARIINKKLDNKIRSRKNTETVRSQYATYEFWKSTMH